MGRYSERELHDMYDEMLDEIYGLINICGYEYDASLALKNIDEVAYRCGFNDYVDAQGYYDEEDEEE